MNVQDQFNTIEVLALISSIVSICYVYIKFPLGIKDSTFFLIFLEKIQDFGMKYRKFQANIGNIAKSQEYRNIGSLDTLNVTTLVVIATDYIGSCKSNYHTITSTMGPINNIDHPNSITRMQDTTVNMQTFFCISFSFAKYN